MNNIDCDQIILFGLVAIFAIYVYRNVLDPNQQGFKVGAQENQSTANINANINEIMRGFSNTTRNLQNINNSINNSNDNLINTNNNLINATNNANNAANNAANIASAISAATNSLNDSVVAANSGTNINNNNNITGSDNTDSIAAPFKNDQLNPDPGGDSVPRSYNVGENKTSSCFPQDVLTAEDLLPKEDLDVIKQFSEESIGDGVLKGIELLAAGFHVGVNSVGQSLRNANQQLRSEPPNPQAEVSPWMNSTIGPDLQRKPLELTESCAKAEGVKPLDVTGINTNKNNNVSINSISNNNNVVTTPEPFNTDDNWEIDNNNNTNNNTNNTG